MRFEEEIEISASPEKVFSLYQAVSAWQAWDPDVERASIDGPFVAGAVGRLKPSGAPESRIIFTDVVPDVSFSVECRLPLCSMRFEHELSRASSGTRALHRVSFLGPLAWFFGRVIGSKIRQGLPGTLRGLKTAAESARSSEPTPPLGAT